MSSNYDSIRAKKTSTILESEIYSHIMEIPGYLLKYSKIESNLDSKNNFIFFFDAFSSVDLNQINCVKIGAMLCVESDCVNDNDNGSPIIICYNMHIKSWFIYLVRAISLAELPDNGSIISHTSSLAE